MATYVQHDLLPDIRPVILAARTIRDARNSLRTWLPDVARATVEFRTGRRRRRDQTVPIRAFGAPAIPIRRPGVLDMRGDMPAITPIEVLTEDDLNLGLRAGLQGVDLGISVEAAAARAAATVDNTMEAMRASAIFGGGGGVLTLQLPDGNDIDVDFEIPADQKVTAPQDLSAPGADLFGFLDTLHELFIDKSGAPAGAMLVSTRFARIAANRLQNAYPQQPVGTGQLAAYLADRGFAPMFTYDRVLEVDGVKTRLTPSNALALLPSLDDPIGETQWGLTQEALRQVQAGTIAPAEAPGLTLQTLRSDNPVEDAVKAAAVGMPTIRDTDSIVVATGLFPAAS
jgi:hypothetical protein